MRRPTINDLLDAVMRWKIVAGATLLLLLAWCSFPRGLIPEGGGWYTSYTSHFPESGGNIRLYRRVPLGIRLLVDERAYVQRFYPPDCIVYERGRDAGTIYAACGNRMPVAVAFHAPWRTDAGYEAHPDRLQRTDTIRVVNGKAVATVVRIPFADIRKTAEAQPPLFPVWSQFAPRKAGAGQPVIRDEPVDVHARGPRGTTPLIEAARDGQRDVVDVLLRHGANVNASDSLGRTPLLMAVMVFDPDTAVVRRILDAGADRNVADRTGATPLLRATISKETDVVRLLLEKGADPCHHEEGGKTIIDYVDGPFSELQLMVKAAFRRCRS